MGLTKTEKFSTAQNEVATLAKAIGHPARVAILEHLLRQGACITKDIVEELPLAQPTISQHLKELKKVGVIKGEIEGTSICYCIDEEKWAAIQSKFNTFFDLSRLKNCC